MGVLPTPESTIVMKTPIWNRANLPPPPVCTVKLKRGTDLRVLNCTIDKIIKTLDLFDIMLYETKLLSAVIKHFRFDFRLDKSFQLVNRVAHALKRCQLLNLKEVFQNFEKTSSQCTAFDYQPSRQMLEYVIVQVQGFIMLLKYLINLCHETGVYLQAKMKIGHYPTIVLALFAVVSRIWSLSKYYSENAFEWYLLLLSSLPSFEPTQVAWLPPGYVFPALPLELDEAPWIDQEKILDSLRSFLSNFQEPTAPSTSMEYLTKTDDLGETISREDLDTLRRALSMLPVEKKPAQEKKTNTHIEPIQEKTIIVRNKPIHVNKTPAQNKPFEEKTVLVTDKPIHIKTTPTQNKPIQDKTNLVPNKPIQEKKIPTQNKPIQNGGKPIHGPNTVRNESRKRKISDSEPEVPQPVKHFFKKKYTRPTDVQTDFPKIPGAKISTPADVTSTNIVQELAKLKRDLSNLGGKPKSQAGGLGPTCKSKVMVVQEKSFGKARLSEKTVGKAIGLDRRKAKEQGKSSGSEETREEKSEKLKKKLPKVRQVVSSDKSRNRLVTRDIELGGDSVKKSVSKEQILLEKRKELAKLRKQKSKSWVIS